jgi:hypothetical protein
MQTDISLFENALNWLQENYPKYRFFTERDVVWTVQTYIQNQIDLLKLPYKVFNDYPMLPGSNRHLSTDLVILTSTNVIEAAAEFKYEPSHNRIDIPKGKFPVVFWGMEGVEKDIKRIHEFVDKGKAKVAYSIFIDEGGYFSNRPPHAQSAWKTWGNGVWVLQSQAKM